MSKNSVSTRSIGTAAPWRTTVKKWVTWNSPSSSVLVTWLRMSRVSLSIQRTCGCAGTRGVGQNAREERVRRQDDRWEREPLVSEDRGARGRDGNSRINNGGRTVRSHVLRIAAGALPSAAAAGLV